ncbi:HK97-gp10 family putative phage morphogenesis protein [Zavarzinella formosa]|uniref:HK97-gp10 family putative phage morphogenesis protein n=1 Tax=Zavarzinella formosa TaxID=360055 RepID=UPI0003122462|nr:HK97-gp10 family putative phage morphogenesis protein [Zavarzinella formosa]
MDFSVKIEGLDRLEQTTQRIREAVAAELAAAMYASAKKIEAEAKRSIAQGGKTGRLYKRGKNVFHRASAPGEAPATDTGLLINSIRGDLDRGGLANGVLQGNVTVGVDYGKMLEFGTQKIAPRPFLFPAFEKSKAWIVDRLNAAVRKGLS